MIRENIELIKKTDPEIAEVIAAELRRQQDPVRVDAIQAVGTAGNGLRGIDMPEPAAEFRVVGPFVLTEPGGTEQQVLAAGRPAQKRTEPAVRPPVRFEIDVARAEHHELLEFGQVDNAFPVTFHLSVEAFPQKRPGLRRKRRKRAAFLVDVFQDARALEHLARSGRAA